MEKNSNELSSYKFLQKQLGYNSFSKEYLKRLCQLLDIKPNRNSMRSTQKLLEFLDQSDNFTLLQNFFNNSENSNILQELKELNQTSHSLDESLSNSNVEKKRCDFSGRYYQLTNEKVQLYHDTRWCKPIHDDKEQFAMLILEGAQAGLSWTTILEKEEQYRIAFDGFDPTIVATYDETKIAELMSNSGIIRNKNKILSAINNAKSFLKVQQEFGSFDNYIWGFTKRKVVDHHLKHAKDMPSQSDLSKKISKDLKERGFSFVGPTIIYSYLQGIGIINDHTDFCEYR